MKFSLLATDHKARVGRIEFARGTIETPVFMPVGTYGAVKGLWNDDLLETGAQIILGNTFHLSLRPGVETLHKLGGLHGLMNWSKPILTDSGGFQVFSLGKLRKLTEEGVRFQAPLDGHTVMLRPEDSMDIQHALGSDITMVLDECPPCTYTPKQLQASIDLTHRWAKRCKDRFLHNKPPQSDRALFGIVQGGFDPALRAQSAEALMNIGFDGYALGGLAIGEPTSKMEEVLSYAPALLPENQPRYLMGVGTPLNLIEAVESGIDMFDCVMPSRNGRNGQAFTSLGLVRLKNQIHRNDDSALDPDCSCKVCQRHSRAYLHHLHRTKESLGGAMLTYHNLHFYHDLMAKMREAIAKGTLSELKKTYQAIFDPRAQTMGRDH